MLLGSLQGMEGRRKVGEWFCFILLAEKNEILWKNAQDNKKYIKTDKLTSKEITIKQTHRQTNFLETTFWIPKGLTN